MNNSSHDDISRNSPFTSFTILRLVVDTLILVFSLLGNILIVSSIWKMKKLRNVFTSVLIVNLAVCDIALVTISIPTDMVQLYGYAQYPFGTFGCVMISPLATYQINAISFIMVLISIERYVTIKYHIQPRAGSVKKTAVTVAIHIVSLATVIPFMNVNAVQQVEGELKCQETWGAETSRSYTIFLFLTQIGVPLPVMVVLYTLSWRIIEKQNTRTLKFVDKIDLRRHPNFVHYICCCFFKINMSFRHCREHRRELKKKLSIASEVSIARRKQTKYYLKMFTAVVVLFTVCMLPNQITWFYLGFHPNPLNQYVRVIFYWLTYANAVFNPWIYAGCNPYFKRAFRSFVKKCVSVCFKQKEEGIAELMKCERAQTTLYHKQYNDMVHNTQQSVAGDFLWMTPWAVQDQDKMPRSISDYNVEPDLYDPYSPIYIEKRKPRVKNFSRRLSDTLRKKSKESQVTWQSKANLSYTMALSYVDFTVIDEDMSKQRRFSEIDFSNNNNNVKKTRRVGISLPTSPLHIPLEIKPDVGKIDNNMSEGDNVSDEDEFTQSDLQLDVEKLNLKLFDELSETFC